MRARLLILWAIPLILTLCTAQAATTYKIHMLDYPPLDTFAVAYDINDAGVVVGASARSSNYANSRRACVWDSAGAHSLMVGNVPSGSINNEGDMVGGSYVWKNGVRNLLPKLISDGQNRLYDINESGAIVGRSKPDTTTTNWRACLWDDNGIHDLGTLPGHVSAEAFAVNDNGQVVGVSRVDESSAAAVLWSNGEVISLGTLPYYGSEAVDINNNGQIIGNCYNASYWQYGTEQKSFLWQNGKLTDVLGFTDRSYHFSAINERSQIVGYTYGQGIPNRAFVWENGELTYLPDLGNFYSWAEGINENGWVVGTASAPDRTLHAVVWEPVPEPASLIALAGGLFSVATIYRKRAR